MNIMTPALFLANLSLASPVRDRRACHARAAVWRVARRVRAAPKCADAVDVRRRSLIEHSCVFSVSLHIDNPTQAHIGTACTSPSPTCATIPPMVRWARWRIPVIGTYVARREVRQCHHFSIPHFNTNVRETRRCAVSGRRRAFGDVVVVVACSRRFHRRRASHRHVSHPTHPLLARGPAHTLEYLVLSITQRACTPSSGSMQVGFFFSGLGEPE
jgi:hypothetical protein